MYQALVRALFRLNHRKVQMSKFLDRLDKINRGATRSIGFGASARTEELPAMAILGRLSDPAKSAQGAANLTKIGADGALIEGIEVEEISKALASSLDSVPWGICVQELRSEQTSHYREQGCDFVAFAAERAFLEAFEDEETAYMLRVQPDMDERHLRAIEDLPVDVVVLRLEALNLPLTIQHLITIGSVRNAFSQYLLLEMPGVPTSGELERLRDIGVDGLVVDAIRLSAKKLQQLKDRLLAVPRRPRGRSGKASAVLPHGAYAPPSSSPSEDDEGEDL